MNNRLIFVILSESVRSKCDTGIFLVEPTDSDKMTNVQ